MRAMPGDIASSRQLEVLRVIHRATARDGYPPTLREIASAIGARAVWAAQWHVGRLEALGLIAREPGRARTIVLTPLGRRAI